MDTNNPNDNSPVTATEADETVERIIGRKKLWKIQEYEQNELGHVYTLDNGNAIVVPLDRHKNIYVIAPDNGDN